MCCILGVLFPGQGVQKLGMLSSFSEHFLIRQTFVEASDILGYDLWNLIQNGPLEELNKTHRSQPAILASSVAIWRLWEKQCGGYVPKFMAGHSLGEYSALVCSGVINFSSAIKLVELRGLFMQEVVTQSLGAMSVIIGLDEGVVVSICKSFTLNDQFVALSAYNAPSHVVISGHRKAVENVNIICKKLGAKFTLILPISVPSHCKLMFPAAQKLQEELEKIKFLMPIIPVVNNVDACIEKNLNLIKKALIRQLYMPVRWKEVIEYLVKCNVNMLLEMGPGNILSRITKRIINDSSLSSVSINDSKSLILGIQCLASR